MKKRLALLLAVIMITSFTACSEKENNKDFGNTEYEGSSFSDKDTPEKDATDGDTSWKQFLKDYEAWVDDYIEIVKKYKEDPSDISLLSDYTKMASEMADWAQRANEIELELEDTDIALEYSAEILRIVGKLTEAIG